MSHTKIGWFSVPDHGVFLARQDRLPIATLLHHGQRPFPGNALPPFPRLSRLLPFPGWFWYLGQFSNLGDRERALFCGESEGTSPLSPCPAWSENTAIRADAMDAAATLKPLRVPFAEAVSAFNT
jgi:hypothetical protein